MGWYRDLSLVKKLAGLVGILLLFLVVVGAISVSSISSVGAKGSGIYSSNTLALEQLGAANTAFSDEKLALVQGLAEASEADVQRQVDASIAGSHATLANALARFEALGLNPRERAISNTLNSALRAFIPLRDKTRALTKAGAIDAAGNAWDQALTSGKAVDLSLDKLTAVNRDEAAAASRAIKSTTASARTMTIALVVIAILLGAAIAFLTIRQIID